jgi:LCP family protein required for cell wall assembly
METVRQLALVLVAPGWTWRRERRPLAAALFVAGVVVPLVVALWAVFSGRSWVALSLDRGFLAWVLVAFVAAVVARVVALVVWLLAGERTRERVGAVSLAGVIAVVPLTVGIVDVAQARADIAPVFTPTENDAAVFDPDAVATTTTSPTAVTTMTTTSTTSPTTTTVRLRTSGPHIDDALPTTTSTTTTTLPPKPARPVSGIDPAAVADVFNVLLLGGDAGPGRAGLRTDTMMLLSVHTPSGRASLVSLPRDLERLLFPPGSALEARYPYGFTEKANAVYPIVSANRSLRAAYDVQGDIRPGVVAIAEAIGYSLDVQIDDYVLIDMQGFIDLIDAVGGVTVQVTKEIPMPGNVPGAKHEYPPTIGPGTIEMDGTTALGYVRSRYADSDFQRTRRQRDLLAALARQVSFADVIGRYGEVTGAVGGTLRTSLTPDELAHMLALIGGETAIVESVGLVPPLVNYRRPDFQRAAEIVGQVRLAIAQGTRSGY